MENTTVIEPPADYVTNGVKNNQQQLATQIQKMQQLCRKCSCNILQGLRTHIKITEAVGTTVDTQIIAAKENAVCNAGKNFEAAVEAMSTGI